jgi:uncharacterized protein DUF2125
MRAKSNPKDSFMPRYTQLAQGAALALCWSATAAMAELTAADVWADWKSYIASSGYSLTASEAQADDTLTISNLNLSMDLSDDEGNGTINVTLDKVRFIEQGDGTVAIELPDTSAFIMSFAPDTGEKVNVTLNFNQTEPVMSVAGEPAELTYNYAAQAGAIILSELMVDGITLGDEIAKVDITTGNIGYVANMSVGELRSIEQDMQIAAIGYDMQFADPEGEGSLKLRGAVQNLTFEGGGDIPVEADTRDINAMLNNGFGIDGTFTTTGGSYEMSFSGPDGSGTANGTSQGADIRVAMDAAGLIYDIVQRNVVVNMLLTEFPFPVSFSASELGTSVHMPLQKSAEAQDFGFALSMKDFTMADVLWGLFDPTGQLPRDPATIAVDLSGKAKVLFDFLDPDQAAILDETGAAPGELNAVTLNALEVDAVGARLTGTGDFVFDNSDLVTFDGMPRPEGAVDLSLVGGNALLDKLVGMGLLPEDQAMGARMMMGLFAVPGDGPDTLKSRIEVNQEGHVLANGQRIR